MLIERVSKAVEAVCPIAGVSLGILGDKSSWSVQFLPQATGPQRVAAQTAIDNFDLAASNAQDAALEQARKDIRADPDFSDLVSKIKNATPTQIKAYVTNNITDLQSAKILLMKILLVLSLE